MLLLRTLLCSVSIVMVLSLRTPSRVQITKRRESSSATGTVQNSTSQFISYNGTAAPAVEITTYAPRLTTSMPQSQLRALCVSPRGKFEHPLDCRKYVDCWDGRVLEKRCPNDLVFSDLPGEFCDYLEYVDCGSRPVLVDDDGTTDTPVTPPQPTAYPPPTAFARWTASSSGEELPPYAVSFGQLFGLRTPVYVGQARIGEHVIPCALFPRNGCYTHWNNEAIIHREYEVLQSNAAVWQPGMTRESDIPDNAIFAGRIDLHTTITPLYATRTTFDLGEFVIPGYIDADSKVMIHSIVGSNVHSTDEYDILVLEDFPVYDKNKY